MNVPLSTINDTLGSFKTHERPKILAKTDRPRKSTSRIGQVIARMVENSGSPSAGDITKELDKLDIAYIHPNTVKNRLIENDLHG